MRCRPAMALVLACSVAGGAGAAALDLPPEQFFPLHKDPAFEARVVEVLGPRPGESPRLSWVRLRVGRVWQGGATTTVTARFTLLSSFVPADEAHLAAARETQGLVPGRDLLVAVSPLAPGGAEFTAVSLGPPDAPAPRPADGSAPGRPGETMLELFRRLAPAVHPTGVAPLPDPAPGATGSTGLLGQ